MRASISPKLLDCLKSWCHISFQSRLLLQAQSLADAYPVLQAVILWASVLMADMLIFLYQVSCEL